MIECPFRWLRPILAPLNKALTLVVLGGCCLSMPSFAAEKALVMTTSVGAPLYFDDGSGLYNRLVDAIFERLALEHQLVWLPSQRSLAFTNDGTHDGNIAGIRAIEQRFENLVRVPEKVFDFEFMVYSKNPDLKITGWDSLEPYVVGIISGWKIVERNTRSARLVTAVNNYEQLLTLLEKKRVDLVVLDRVMGGWTLQQLGYDLSAIEPPIVNSPMFIYLHRKHERLLPLMARVISEMKRDGSFAAIYQRVLPGHSGP